MERERGLRSNWRPWPCPNPSARPPPRPAALVGTASLTPLSVYRYVHSMHHAHLGRPRDPEFWPYSLPEASRLVRVLYVALELSIG